MPNYWQVCLCCGGSLQAQTHFCQEKDSQLFLIQVLAECSFAGLVGLHLTLPNSQVKRVYNKLLQSKEERWKARKALLNGSIDSLSRLIVALTSLPENGTPPDLSGWSAHLHSQV